MTILFDVPPKKVSSSVLSSLPDDLCTKKFIVAIVVNQLSTVGYFVGWKLVRVHYLDDKSFIYSIAVYWDSGEPHARNLGGNAICHNLNCGFISYMSYFIMPNGLFKYS